MRGWVAIIGLGCGASTDAPKPAATPNIVLVTIETVRADHVGPLMGYPIATMPLLSERAKGGRVFSRAFSPSSWTLPSIVSMYTGLSPTVHGVDRIERRIPDQAPPTLGKVLHQAGYQTAFFGVNPVFSVDRGLAAGIDVWQAEVGWSAGKLNQAVFSFLDRRDGRPLFLHVHYFDPHCPYTPPPDALGMVPPTTDQGRVPAGRIHELGGCYGIERENGEIEDDLSVYFHRYDAELRSTDNALDRLLKRLAERGIVGNDDVLVVTSDHGEAFWEHDDYGHSHTLWGETTWVPLVIWAPWAPAGVEDRPVGLTGLYGTLLASIGPTAGTTLADTALYGFSQSTRAGGRPFEAWLASGEKWMTDGASVWTSNVVDDPLDREAKPSERQRPRGSATERPLPAALLEPTDDERARLRALGYSL